MAKKKKQTSNQLEIQNAAKTLYANIRFLSVDRPIRSIVITSSVPNEGKSTTAVNLAQAIATSGKRVLLVETDMRRRSLANMLNVRSSAGLYAVVTNTEPISSAVASTATTNLWFLDVEPSIPNPADLLASRRFAQFGAQLEDLYDYVIYDTPPVGTFVDAAIISTLVDATLLVVRPGLVKRTELQNAYEQLQKADANVIGVCATFVEGSGSEYYYAYYTESGKRVKEAPVEVPAGSAVAAASSVPAVASTAAPSKARGNNRHAQSRQQAYRQQVKGTSAPGVASLPGVTSVQPARSTQPVQPAQPMRGSMPSGMPAGRNVDGTYQGQPNRGRRH